LGLKIGLDIDGVVADSFPIFLQELNKYFHKDIRKIDNYNIGEIYGVGWQDIDAFFKAHVEYLFSEPKPMAGAVETIESWFKAGHEVVYVTARKKGLEEKLTLQWLERNAIPYKKTVFAGGETKTAAVREFQLDVFVDDFMSNALEIAALNVPVLLLDAPYNQGKVPKGVIRCYNWNDIQCHIEKLAAACKEDYGQA